MSKTIKQLTVINTIQDAAEFVNSFIPALEDKTTIFDGFLFDDSKISMNGGGSTSLFLYIHDSCYYQFSIGKNWSDQSPSLIGSEADMKNFVWNNRKDINRALKNPL